MIKTPTAGFLMSLLPGSAFAAAVFFQGFYTEFLCLTLTLLVLWGLWVVWASYNAGLALPKTSVAICLALYWVWLGVSAVWGRVAYLGTINFWWLAALPLVFFIYVSSPYREALWRQGFRWVVFIAVALVIGASYQWVVLGQEPIATFINRQSLAALLNLTAIPLAGYFLLRPRAAPRWRHWVEGAAIFLLAFGVALMEGRGATISGGVALLILVGVAWRYVPRRLVVHLVAIVLFAFFVASQLGPVGVGQRLEALVGNPHEAGAGRLVIWRQSWEMLKESPWMGVGIGHYALYWPPYRHPSDGSGGFFVHNDYLQIWIEAGLPGLLLLVGVLVSVLVMYLRAMRRRAPATRKVEMTTLFAGLLAVAMHSFVDFNLYVLSILLLAGLVLGRLHVLAWSERPAAVFSFAPSKFVSERGYRILAVLLAAFALLYFLTLGLASFEYRKGLRLAEQTSLKDAYVSLDRAARYYPYADNVLMSKADLLRHIITVVPESSADERKSMFEESRGLLARAEDLNPLRPQTFAVRAFLYEQNPAFAGSEWAHEVARNYRRTIELEPRAYQARHLYASFLLKQGRRDEARRVLEEGMAYSYIDVEPIVPYLTLTARLRAQSGDNEGALALSRRIEPINEEVRRKARLNGTPLPEPGAPRRDMTAVPATK